MRSDGRGVRELTFSNAYDGDPAWSRVNKLAFESERTGNSEIWSISSNGSNELQLTNSPAFDGALEASRSQRRSVTQAG